MERLDIFEEYKQRFLDDSSRRDFVKIIRENKKLYQGPKGKDKLPYKDFKQDPITEEDDEIDPARQRPMDLRDQKYSDNEQHYRVDAP